MGNNGNKNWSIKLMRNLNDWKLDEYMNLIRSLSFMKVDIQQRINQSRS